MVSSAPRSKGPVAAALVMTAGYGMTGLGFVPSPSASLSNSHASATQTPGLANELPTAQGTTRGQAAASAVVALAAAGAGAAAAASTRRQQRPRTTLAAAAAADEPVEPPFDPAKQVGVTLPMNYFDPLGFSKVGDREGFYNLRCAELKHGRVAMIASLGMVVPHAIKFPGFTDVPNGVQAVITPPGTFGFLAVLAAAGFVETQVWVQDPKKQPGDFGDPAGFGQYYDEWRNRELNNCRMAMISSLAIIVAELNTGKDGVDQIWGTSVGNLAVE